MGRLLRTSPYAIYTGLEALVTPLALREIAADADQIKREFGNGGEALTSFDLVRAAWARPADAPGELRPDGGTLRADLVPAGDREVQGPVERDPTETDAAIAAQRDENARPTAPTAERQWRNRTLRAGRTKRTSTIRPLPASGSRRERYGRNRRSRGFAGIC